MKHTKRKLVLLMLLSMVVAFAVIAVACHLILSAHIRQRAESSLALYMQDKEEIKKEDAEAAMVVTSFTYETVKEEPEEEESFWENLWNSLFNADSWNSEDVFQAYYSDEILAWWEEAQPEAYSVNRVMVSETPLYVSWKYDETKAGLMRFYYVNVSSEEQLLQTVRITLYVIMAVCLTGACLTGFFMGKKIESDQDRQKRFFENASHELKTPLMSIQGYAEGLQEGITEPEKATKVILNETDKMTGLVNDILSISRLESGAYKLNKEQVLMQDFLSECLSSMESMIREKNLRVVFDVADIALEADRGQLEKAVRNILSNAIRYAKSEIRILYDGKKLEIWDDGTPISEEGLKHLFERFYIGQGGNTGIGMSLTREIIQQHGWKIRGENTLGGVRFVITF